jgi:hypothetical protein
MTKKSKYDMPAVQNFAFGGIANPTQRAFLRGSDKAYLSERQKELDAFEEQRQAYNSALTKYQTEVYNPYKAQADAYNTAAQRYNEEVYNPYKTQYDEYLRSIEAYNAGPRTEDYTGPAAPTLARAFDMTAPATPTSFDNTAPVLPFKEEDVIARQQQAAGRAREDAGNRAVAIDVVSDPDKYNFGSMSVANRFMAEGGEVTDDSDDRAASSIIKDFESYGYTKEEIIDLADKVAAAGRGGDELLAYLSPESVEFLKSRGGSGTINPMTGLPEFKGGILGKVGRAIKRVFNPRSAAPAAVAVAEPGTAEPPDTLKPAGPTAAELAAQLDAANKAREALATKSALDLATLKEQQAAALKAQQDASTAAQQLAIQNALKADAEARAKAALPISNVINKTNAPGGLTGAAALSLMYRSTQGGVPTSEFEKYGGYDAVSKAAAAAGFNPTPKWIDSYEKSMKMPESEYTKRNKLFFSPGGGGYNNPDAGSWDGITPGGGYVPLPKAALTAIPSIGTTQKTTNVTSLPSNFSTIGASTGIGKIDLGGPLDVGWSRYLDKQRDEEKNKTPVTGSMFGSSGQRTDITADQIPVTQPTLYQTKGVGQIGQVGQVGDVGGINITGPASPIFGASPISQGGAATDPKSYFALSQTSNPGINAGTTALGPSSLPVAGAVNTLNTIGANPNLSPTMLGGTQNAGFFTDRMGNRIVAPGLDPLRPPGFAKGGDVSMADIMAMNTETLSDEKPEEVINTNPVGTAQKYLADLSSAGKPSPTRQSVKRTKTTAGGGATAEKAMQMAYEGIAKGDLGAMKDRAPAARNTESARAQMEELARVYQMKIRSAQNAARGLSADTFGAPTLEQPTLTKGSLTKKRFKDGGEAKKAGAQEAEEPGILRVTSYSTDAAERMFPGQMGQDDQRDAARHMLAAATLAKKVGPGAAVFLGKAHERMSNPESFFSMLGIGKPRDDYEMDVHNNKLGADLGSRTTSQAELEKLVRAMAMQAQNKQVEGKPWTMSKEQMKNRKGQITTQPPEYRAEGSPPEGELSQEEIDAASKPAFVTPKSGKGRKQGEISKQLKSGDAYVNMAKGLTEMPYNIAGAPMDLAMLVRQGLTGQAPAGQVGTSDYIKSKMTELGIRQAPPSDPTSKGFYTAGDLLSNLANPAGVTRSAVKGAQKTGEAATAVAKDFQEYNRQLAVPGASYAVRPTGSTIVSGPIGMKESVSGVDNILNRGLENAKTVAGQNDGQALIIQDFWDKKARNYFTRQFGTPDDPIARGIANKQIRGSSLEEDFPEYLIDQIAAGKTRVKEGVKPEGFVGPGTPESRFFPKYPRAMDDFTARYDKATDLKGVVLTSDPAAARPEYSNLLSEQGKQLGRTAQVAEEDKLLMQGLRPELINANVGTITRSPTDYDRVIGDLNRSAEDLFKAYKEASMMNKMDKPEKTNWINQLMGQGRKIMGKTEDEVVQNMLPENIMTAINKGEPVYDMQYGLQKPLQAVFDPISINKYLASIPPREAANIRFEDAIKGALKMREQTDQRAMLVERIKSGKPVADSVFAKGVSAPLLQFEEGPYKGFAWKRIEDRAATVPEGAYVGHSVGGYETGGAGYSADKREGFGTGKWQVYTLRDNRNRPVNTIEVKMLDEFTPVVTQIKGNGRASGNTAPEKYDGAVLDFLQKYLKPSSIEESDSHLTPLLQNYKKGLGPDALDKLNFI